MQYRCRQQSAFIPGRMGEKSGQNPVRSPFGLVLKKSLRLLCRPIARAVVIVKLRSAAGLTREAEIQRAACSRHIGERASASVQGLRLCPRQSDVGRDARYTNVLTAHDRNTNRVIVCTGLSERRARGICRRPVRRVLRNRYPGLAARFPMIHGNQAGRLMNTVGRRGIGDLQRRERRQ